MNQSSQKIGVATATLIGINSMVGAGIFSAPAKLASSVGPAGILTYFFVIIAVWCMAFSFARLAQLIPQEGSFYTYTRAWAGHGAGLLAAASYLIGIIIALGLLAQLAGIYLHDYIPQVSPYILGLIVIVCLVALNIVGGITSRIGQFISIACTTIPIAAITVMCLAKANFANLTPFAPYGFSNVLRATSAVIFGFFGFESTVSLFGNVQSPQQNVPRALRNTIIIVSVIYFLFIVSIMLAIPAPYFTGATTPLSHPLNIIFPDRTWIISLIHFSILSSFFGVVNAMIWSTSSLFLSLIKKGTGTLTKQLTKTGILRQQTAVLAIGALIVVSYSSIGNIDLFFSFTSLFVIFAFVMSLIALFKLERHRMSFNFLQDIIGIATALVIFGFALEEVVTRLFL